MDVEQRALTAGPKERHKKSVLKCMALSFLNSPIYRVKFVIIYLSLLMVPEFIILFASDVIFFCFFFLS
jgi:hypothetical protein